MEGATEKPGSVAFEVILKPACGDVPPAIAGSPTKERPLSQVDIDRKLREAEERRLSLEASKRQPIVKDMERLHEANQKVQEMTETFAKETEKKLSEKMETTLENKNAQLLAKQERLKEHDRHIEEVRKKKLSMCEDASNVSGDGDN